MSLPNVDWTNYAAVYDIMAKYNPAYHHLIGLVIDQVKKWHVGGNDMLVDFGAGTGNFTLAMATIHQEAKIVHIDSDNMMIDLARSKSHAYGLTNISFIKCEASALQLESGSISAAICIHALYAFSEPKIFLVKLYDWLKPDAPFILCNFGRQMETRDWAIYLFQHIRRQYGIIKAVELLFRGRRIAKYNRQIAMKQRLGEYWTHTPNEIRQVIEDAGFYVKDQQTCYRNYSDFLVCVKPSS